MARRKRKMLPVSPFPVGQLVKIKPIDEKQTAKHVPWGSLGIVTMDPNMWAQKDDGLTPYPMAAVRFFINPAEIFVPTAMLTPIDLG